MVTCVLDHMVVHNSILALLNGLTKRSSAVVGEQRSSLCFVVALQGVKKQVLANHGVVPSSFSGSHGMEDQIRRSSPPLQPQ